MVVIVLLAVAALFLPRRVHFEQQAIVDADAEAVLTRATSGAGYQRINPYKNTDPDLSITLFGQASGVGFHFTGRERNGSQAVSAITGDAVHHQVDLGPAGKPLLSMTAGKPATMAAQNPATAP